MSEGGEKTTTWEKESFAKWIPSLLAKLWLWVKLHFQVKFSILVLIPLVGWDHRSRLKLFDFIMRPFFFGKARLSFTQAAGRRREEIIIDWNPIIFPCHRPEWSKFDCKKPLSVCLSFQAETMALICISNNSRAQLAARDRVAMPCLIASDMSNLIRFLHRSGKLHSWQLCNMSVAPNRSQHTVERS